MSIELSDEQLEAECDYTWLVRQYKRLRDHHVAETTRLLAQDRALLAQMAATIASTSMNVPTSDPMRLAQSVVIGSVHIARMILAEVDKK